MKNLNRISVCLAVILSQIGGVFAAGDPKDYQIGDVWGRKLVTSRIFRRESKVFQKSVRATAHYLNFGSGNSATGVYLGKFNGHHVIATNHHVAVSDDFYVCKAWTKFIFSFLGSGHRREGVQTDCERIIGSWPEIDFGLIEIGVSPNDEKVFKDLGVSLASNFKIERGTPLLTIGFGRAGNPDLRMSFDQDDDCIVYSMTGEYRKISDPDAVHPFPYQAWSFANGCDVSHGDSGAPLFDRNTGELLGILWTGATPKDPRVQTRTYLDRLDRTDPEIWTKLNYAVPVSKIREYLSSIVTALPSDDAKIVEAILKLE